MSEWICPFCDAAIPTTTEMIGSEAPCPRCGMESIIEDPGTMRSSAGVRPKTKVTPIPIVSTEEFLIPDMVTIQHKPTVSARRVYGINVVAEALAGIRDVVGGRSNRIEEALANIERELETDIRSQAGRCGANAVVCFRVQFGNLSSSGSLMLFGVAHGTPVLIRPREPLQEA